MTNLANDPDDFADEALRGLIAAHPERVMGVTGGVVRSTASPRGQVSVIAGGGTGHYPAFAGWVGPGLVHGAACGQVFASPAASQVASVARAADNGGGLLFLPINYAGDILSFGGAAEQLRAEGTDVRMVAITDDLASGETDQRDHRRGIAGSLVVLKVACAAAETGAGLDEIEAIAQRTNRATATLGVAFSGCTLPGADGPLFTLQEGQMALGLGIHGEPGLSELDRLSADETVDLLLDRLTAEHELRAGMRVAVVLNGLGALSHEALYIAFGRVSARLVELGVDLVSPAVGEFVTSLDMSGFSLTLTILDDELETLWAAPVDSPAFSRGAVGEQRPRGEVTTSSRATEKTVGSPASQAGAKMIFASLQAASAVIDAEQDRLGELDAIAGDGDHGVGMHRGLAAAVAAAGEAVEERSGAGAVLAAAGGAWAERSGGTSGALWGAGLAAMAQVVGDDTDLDLGLMAGAWRGFADTICKLGGATAGDKTMIDAVLPFVASLEESVHRDRDLVTAWRTAATQAEKAADQTADFAATLGRARTHGSKSVGSPDPGAVSFSLVAAAMVPGARDQP